VTISNIKALGDSIIIWKFDNIVNEIWKITSMTYQLNYCGYIFHSYIPTRYNMVYYFNLCSKNQYIWMVHIPMDICNSKKLYKWHHNIWILQKKYDLCLIIKSLNWHYIMLDWSIEISQLWGSNICMYVIQKMLLNF
jgi:hypothetical protein